MQEMQERPQAGDGQTTPPLYLSPAGALPIS